MVRHVQLAHNRRVNGTKQAEVLVNLGLEEVDGNNQAPRAMDLLVTADAHGRMQEAVFFAAVNLLNLEVDLILFDATSTYFERFRAISSVTARTSPAPMTTGSRCGGWGTPRTTAVICHRS